MLMRQARIALQSTRRVFLTNKKTLLGASVATLFAGSQVAWASPNAKVFSWGNNQYGQLGLGDQVNRPLPSTLSGLSGEDVVHVSAGDDCCVALTRSGKLYTWGRGQNLVLGHGDDSGLNSPKLLEAEVAFRFADISGTHGVAIDVDGNLWSWGSKALGREGYESAYPERVDAGGMKFRVVACGRKHSLAISESGHLYTWGDNFEGALGLGTRSDRTIPTLVPSLTDHKIQKVSAGDGFSMILTDKGELYTCGMGDYGQTGQGTSADRYVRTPKLVRSLQKMRVVDISAGTFHAACVTDTGDVFAWGCGKDGQVGSGARDLLNTVPQQVQSIKGMTHVSCGNGHTAALSSTGELYVWGRGRDGQIGRADKTESMAAARLTPVKVEYFTQPVQSVALGSEFSTAVV